MSLIPSSNLIMPIIKRILFAIKATLAKLKLQRLELSAYFQWFKLKERQVGKSLIWIHKIIKIITQYVWSMTRDGIKNLLLIKRHVVAEFRNENDRTGKEQWGRKEMPERTFVRLIHKYGSGSERAESIDRNFAALSFAAKLSSSRSPFLPPLFRHCTIIPPPIPRPRSRCNEAKDSMQLSDSLVESILSRMWNYLGPGNKGGV